MRWLLVVALAAACGDNLGPAAVTPDAEAPTPTARWTTVALAAPGNVLAAWDPDRQVLVTSDSYSTWELVDEHWRASPSRPPYIDAGMYFDERRHQVGAIGSSNGLIAMSWNGLRWQGLTRTMVVGTPKAVAADPVQHALVVFTVSDDGSTVNEYSVGSSDASFVSSINLPVGPEDLRAIYDVPSASAVFAGLLRNPVQGIIRRVHGTEWTALVPPGDLAAGYAFGTIDSRTELVVEGSVYRLEANAWSQVASGLPRGRPLALWQTRDGDRHVLYANALYRERAGEWMTTPLLAASDSLALARARNVAGYELFARTATATPVVRWQLVDGVATRGSASAPPAGHRGAFALAVAGRDTALYGGGSDSSDNLVSTFDGVRFAPLLVDPTVEITATRVAYDAAAQRVAAIAIDPFMDSPTTDSAHLVTLPDSAAAWMAGPGLPGGGVIDTSLAYDPMRARVVAARQVGFDTLVTTTVLLELDGDAWVPDDTAPGGAYVVATDEHYGSLVTIEEQFEPATSWERTNGVWELSTPPPLTSLRVAGTAYDPDRHELAVLAQALGGWVVLVRHRD